MGLFPVHRAGDEQVLRLYEGLKEVYMNYRAGVLRESRSLYCCRMAVNRLFGLWLMENSLAVMCGQ